MLTSRPSISLLAVKPEFWFTAVRKAPAICARCSSQEFCALSS